MRIETRSRAVLQAVAIVLRRMPEQARRTVEGFVVVIRAESNYDVVGVGVTRLGRASAGLYPLYKKHHLAITDDYEAQIIVMLPVFKLFSRKAQIGIIAHEFAHAVQASRMGRGWHEQMQSRYAAGDRFADRTASRWGFGDSLQDAAQRKARGRRPAARRAGAVYHASLI